MEKTTVCTFVDFQRMNTERKTNCNKSIDKRMHIVNVSNDYIEIFFQATGEKKRIKNVLEIISKVVNNGCWIDNVTSLKPLFKIVNAAKSTPIKTNDTTPKTAVDKELFKNMKTVVKGNITYQNKSKGLTVGELCYLCLEQIEKGNINKHVLISDDDEGNGYHTLFYSFTDNIQELAVLAGDFHDNNDYRSVVVLG